MKLDKTMSKMILLIKIQNKKDIKKKFKIKFFDIIFFYFLWIKTVVSVQAILETIYNL